MVEYTKLYILNYQNMDFLNKITGWGLEDIAEHY